ncbi:hypothetical protein A1O3_09469 [Capronia epimyces CBS 606.96]|uniref:Uncharacterized protein n=1 Tax=Capronia epimyces CBS 606.96 TaxID=1182542 RepID=W9XDL1_9EURO|nr:uncharacterized protein A1O3_09469 [Capronia epimyces CBS 606.96]EXJ78308.1 hypothetical protein A1O3_09469 [Capronia epimyces CBS 606.96]
MSVSLDLEAQRSENLQQKRKLLDELNLNLNLDLSSQPNRRSRLGFDGLRPAKKRRLNTSTPRAIPSRTSARIAASGARTSYTEERERHEAEGPAPRKSRRPPTSRYRADQPQQNPPPPSAAVQSVQPSLPSFDADLASLLDQYNSWQPAASEPTLLPDGTYHFESHPTFRPNKSPLSILLEGAFGGHHFSPWHSRTLRLTLCDDYLRTLPPSWLSHLQPAGKYLVSPTYDASLNRYGVTCGQTLTQWEDAGWINFTHDPRGWFEWYIRFWLGRRCDDGEDERQVGRWLRCVGPRGRWKRLLLKKYVDLGVKSIFDDDGREDGQEVSPVMHQTCHHWAYQVRQEDLDDAWKEKGG